MRFTASIANSIWTLSNLPAFRRFERALHHPDEVQTRLLLKSLARNKGCDYGRQYDFAGIRTYEEFARRVPLVTYDDIEPWISRIANGKRDILCSEPVTRLVPTSGSSGASKLIPFTAGLQREFNAAIAPWVCDLYRAQPSLAYGPAYWAITPVSQTKPPDSVVPVGFDDDAGYLGGVKKYLVDKVMAVPPQVRLLGDMQVFRYVTLLCLLRERHLRFISVWHPSFLTLLLDALPGEFDDLIQDIRTGRCKYADRIPSVAIGAFNFRPLPKRAEELRRVGATALSLLWPSLKAISCWGEGPAATALTDMQRRFPGVDIQPKGLLATEGVVTIPFARLYPAAVCSHFFEFIGEDDQVRPACDLRENNTYEVVLTTAGGLWRYRLGDFVRVTGFAGRTPALKFLGRGSSVSSFFGEKLSEIFVSGVLQKASEITGLKPVFAMLAPDDGAAGLGYTLYVEDHPPEDLGALLDRMLRENPHYAWCRDLGQLQPARIFSITGHAYAIYSSHLAQKGARMGEIKPALLSTEKGWSKIFPGSYSGIN